MPQQSFAVETGALGSFSVFHPVAPDARDSIAMFCIAGSGGSAVFCTIKDEAFGIGGNLWGVIGTGHQKGAAQPKRIGELSGKGMRGLAGGWRHCLGVTGDGQVYSWGWNRFGQLGRGNTAVAAAAERPAVVPGLPEVASVACGSVHSLALTAAGEVYAWGFSGYGQCGLRQATVRRPVKVRIPWQAAVTAVAAGDWHSAALTEDGKVFCWGGNECGQLGSGEVGVSSAEAMEVAAPAGGFVRVSCGWDHTLGLTGEGVVLAWGWNSGGMLAVGEAAEKVARPKVVLQLERATGILAAGHHSAAETAAGVCHWGGTGGDQWTGPGRVVPVTKAEGLGVCLAGSPLSLRVRKAASAAVEVTVMDCGYPNVLLGGEQREAVEQAILEAYDAEDAENPEVQVRLNGCGQGKGYVVVNCADGASAGWVMEVVRRMKPPLKALVLPVDCTVCVPRGKGQSLTAANFLDLLNLGNRSLDTKQWAVWDTATEGGQVWSISMDEKSLEELRRLDMKPYFRIGRIHFQLKKKPEPAPSGPSQVTALKRSQEAQLLTVQ